MDKIFTLTTVRGNLRLTCKVTSYSRKHYVHHICYLRKYLNYRQGYRFKRPVTGKQRFLAPAVVFSHHDWSESCGEQKVVIRCVPITWPGTNEPRNGFSVCGTSKAPIHMLLTEFTCHTWHFSRWVDFFCLTLVCCQWMRGLWSFVLTNHLSQSVYNQSVLLLTAVWGPRL